MQCVTVPHTLRLLRLRHIFQTNLLLHHDCLFPNQFLPSMHLVPNRLLETIAEWSTYWNSRYLKRWKILFGWPSETEREFPLLRVVTRITSSLCYWYYFDKISYRRFKLKVDVWIYFFVCIGHKTACRKKKHPHRIASWKRFSFWERNSRKACRKLLASSRYLKV
jgi:hypothetical protein